MVNFEHLGVEVYLDDGGYQANVFVVCDSASIIDFSSKEVQHFVGDLFVLV